MAKAKSDTVEVMAITKESVDIHIVGVSPLILNRLTEKVKRELLAPKGRKTAADKAGSMKHDPVAEFRASAHRIEADDAPTLLAMPAAAFKRAMGTAALDLPGVEKAPVLRLIYVEGDMIPIYGLPKMFMAITRSAGITRAPDVRTRAILPEWACKITVTFTRPIMRIVAIRNLLTAAGINCGVGDWRQEKGSGSYGAFRIVEPDDADYRRIAESGGRAVQEAAMQAAEPLNAETRELQTWFEDYVKGKGFTPTTA